MELGELLLIAAFATTTLVSVAAGLAWKRLRQLGVALAVGFVVLLAVALLMPACTDARGPDGAGVPTSSLEEILMTGQRVSYKLSGPVWRTSVRAAEDGSALAQLKAHQEFDLRVRFAWLPRDCDDEVEHPVGPRVAEIVADGVALDLVLIADPRYFAVLDGGQARRIVMSSDLPEDPCDSDLADLDPLIAQTAADFRLLSKDRLGRGSVAVVVYRDGRPIDEIPMKICVGACPGEHPVRIDNVMGDVLGELLNEADTAPATDASLYVFDFSSAASAGVLALRNESGDFQYRAWPVVNADVEAIRDKLLNTYAPVLSRTEQTEELIKKGEELAEVIFPREHGEAARSSLEEFILARHKAAQPPPSLFVRIASMDDSRPLVFPVGLIAMRGVTDGTGFIGRYARVAMPLSRQNYEAFEECPRQILTVLPSPNDANAALRAARIAMSDEVGNRWWAAAGGEYQWSSTKTFGEWLLKEPTLDASAALFILSHHHNGSIWIDTNETVESEAVARLTFTAPSWVVLNGCGTIRPAGTGFAEQFNQQGAQAVIATHSEVSAQLAGAYFKCMDAALAKAANDAKYDLGHAHFDATRCLWDETQVSPDLAGEQKVVWGANALKYTLLGNPNLRACPIG